MAREVLETHRRRCCPLDIIVIRIGKAMRATRDKILDFTRIFRFSHFRQKSSLYTMFSPRPEGV